MKLAEALIQRKAIQGRIEQLKEAIEAMATTAEGLAPDEDPKALDQETVRAGLELEALIIRINRTNLAATLEDGRSLTAAIAHRDFLQSRFRFLRTLLGQVLKRNKKEYYEHSMRQAANLVVPDLRATLDGVGKELRELDTVIQQANWAVDVLD